MWEEMTADFSFHWCRSAEKARQLAALFAANLSPEYISHSELQGPRAASPTQWNPDIAATLEREFVERVDQPLDAPANGQTTLVAYAEKNGMTVGSFLVTFSRTAVTPYAILEDMMVAPAERSHGAGAAFVDWIAAESARRGVKRLFLESGLHNEHAHHFFERVGFEKVSVVMMKEL